MSKLPNFCSAETCEQGAVETSAIASKWLRHTEEMMVNAEFVYCSMVAAKVLLVHSYYYNMALSSEFFTLVQNLEEMSRRWRSLGGQNREAPATDLAGTYASRLRDYHARCQKEPEFADKILAYSGAEMLNSRAQTVNREHDQSPSAGNTTSINTRGGVARSEREETVTPMHFPRQPPEHGPSTTASPVNQITRPASTQTQVGPVSNEMNLNGFRTAEFGTPDNLMLMSGYLNGPAFNDMDRVRKVLHHITLVLTSELSPQVIYSSTADYAFFSGQMNDMGYNYNPS
jgi:sRNA-binding protein